MSTKQHSDLLKDSPGSALPRWTLVSSLVQAILVICTEIAVIALVNIFLTRTSAPNLVFRIPNVLFGLILLAQLVLIGLSFQAYQQKNTIGFVVKDIFNALCIISGGVQLQEIAGLKESASRVLEFALVSGDQGAANDFRSSTFPIWVNQSVSQASFVDIKASIVEQLPLLNTAYTIGIVITALVGTCFVLGACLTYLTSKVQEWKVIQGEALPVADYAFVRNYHIFMGLILLQVYFGIGALAISVLFFISGSSLSIYVLIFACIFLIANYPCGYYGVFWDIMWVKVLYAFLIIGYIALLCVLALAASFMEPSALTSGWMLAYIIIPLGLDLALLVLVFRSRRVNSVSA